MKQRRTRNECEGKIDKSYECVMEARYYKIKGEFSEAIKYAKEAAALGSTTGLIMLYKLYEESG